MKLNTAFSLYTGFLISLLIGASCAPDDPIGIFEESRNPPVENVASVFIAPSTTTVPLTTTTILSIEPARFEDDPNTELYGYPIIEILSKDYTWMERSDEVAVLQEYLQVSTDGVYGAQTRNAHLEAMQSYGLTTANIPQQQQYTVTYRPRPMRDNVPMPLLAEIQNLWPEDQWARAVEVAWCESNFIVDAKNPTSTASGYFQLLRPWTKDPEDGGAVWGWIYDESGRKLSAAAGLGITENEARWTIRNVRVAYEIWWRGGNSWSPWNASRHCWG